MSAPATVFVVDDDPSAHESLRILLGTVGLVMEGYTAAGKFLEHYQPDRLGCLVLDVRMPGMSGLELQAELQRRGSPLPILFITGQADVPMAVQAIQAGAFAFLEKPYGDQHLIDLLHKAIRQDAIARSLDDERRAHATRLKHLSVGERQVLNMLLNGSQAESQRKNH